MLIAGVFLTGYLLLLQWQADYGEQPAPPPPSEPAEIEQGETIRGTIEETTGRNVEGIQEGIEGSIEEAIRGSEVPAVPAPVEQELLDVPLEQRVITEEATEGTVKTEQPSVSTPDTILVETDKLRLHISKRGGDIVQAAIKDHRQLRNQDSPLLLLRQDNQRLAIAQSGLIGRDGFDATVQGRPLYQTEQETYRLTDGQESLTVPLSYSQNGVEIIKEFVIPAGQYQIDTNFYVNNEGSQDWQANMFAQFRRDDKSPLYEAESFGIRSFTGAALTLNEKSYKKLNFDDMAKGDFQETVRGGWIAMVQHYYVAAWVPVDLGKDYVYSTRQVAGNRYIFGLTAPAFQVPAGGQAMQSLRFYVGPKSQETLEKLAPKIVLTIDYGWLWYISQPLFRFLNFIHKYVNNWGLAIVVMTFIIKLVFFPLTNASYKSMARMRKLQPKIQNLRENFGDNRQRMQEELMRLYKKEKVNPLGGCLPLLIQMPIFIAFYWTLIESVELRHAPFYLWIQDLSTQDPYFILPLLMGVSMFLQQQLSPTPPDPMQARIMKFLPVIFTVFFLWFPAGLVLYWLVNNILAIIQQYIITRRLNLADGKQEPVFDFLKGFKFKR